MKAAVLRMQEALKHQRACIGQFQENMEVLEEEVAYLKQNLNKFGNSQD